MPDALQRTIAEFGSPRPSLVLEQLNATQWHGYDPVDGSHASGALDWCSALAATLWAACRLQAGVESVALSGDHMILMLAPPAQYHCRAWYLIETHPGRWQAELWERWPRQRAARISRTDAGPLRHVRRVVDSLGDGLPILTRPLGVRGERA